MLSSEESNYLRVVNWKNYTGFIIVVRLPRLILARRRHPGVTGDFHPRKYSLSLRHGKYILENVYHLPVTSKQGCFYRVQGVNDVQGRGDRGVSWVPVQVYQVEYFSCSPPRDPMFLFNFSHVSLSTKCFYLLFIYFKGFE